MVGKMGRNRRLRAGFPIVQKGADEFWKNRVIAKGAWGAVLGYVSTFPR